MEEDAAVVFAGLGEEIDEELEVVLGEGGDVPAGILPPLDVDVVALELDVQLGLDVIVLPVEIQIGSFKKSN